MRELEVAAKRENVELVTAFFEELMETVDAPMKAVMQTNIVIDEIFSNIVNYSYPDGEGMARIEIELMSEPEACVQITFIDSGIPYNPLEKDDPDLALVEDEDTIGGLGIFMTRQLMDDVSYSYEDGKNRLKITKKW